MGPRPFGRGRRILSVNVDAIALLQWGRDLSVAEGAWRAAEWRADMKRFNGAATFRSRKGHSGAYRIGTRRVASMGPRPFGRGRRWLVRFRFLDFGASMGPRPFGRGRRTRAPVRGAAARFNGAATFRSRKERKPNDAGRQADASMGPRPFGRGRVLTLAVRAPHLALQWGRDLSVAEGFRPLEAAVRNASFNGAATFRSRKAVALVALGCADHLASMGPRPFGRGRAEYNRRQIEHYAASMGPRPFGRGRLPSRMGLPRTPQLQWGRDLSVAEGGVRHGQAPGLLSCFNGAATFRSRKDPKMHLLPSVQSCASMGPRPFGRGRTRSGLTSLESELLQWGRDLSVAEGGHRRRQRGAGPHLASMGPRPFGRGRPAMRPPRHSWRPASMGPRPFGRGRRAAGGFSLRYRMLQWGRDLSVAEGRARK